MNRDFLTSLYLSGVEVSKPNACLGEYFTAFSPNERVCILGAGKAAADMAQEAYRYFGNNAYGAVVTRYGYEAEGATGNIRVLTASHPVPDENSVIAANTLMNIASEVPQGEQVIFLISGGGSALACAPAKGVTLEEKLGLHKFLLRSGASIEEMNTVRKHVSLIKGGRLAAASKGNNTSLVISDVVGDNPAMIASGLTVEDNSSPKDAVAILQKYGFGETNSITKHLKHAPPLPKVTGDYHIVANANTAIDVAVTRAQEEGWKTHVISYEETGEASEVAKRHAKLALDCKAKGERCLLFSGGELTVTLGDTEGEGGPNQEYLMVLAKTLNGEAGICALAADTDGVDGSKEVAGGYIDATTLTRAVSEGLDIKSLIAQHNSFAFFDGLGDHIVIGPTRTNVNDFRVICVF